MASQVFFHVGLPKTGTTYLQTVLWGNADVVREQGVLLPGRSVREHLWASGGVREDPRLRRRGPRAPGAWDRIVADVRAWPGTAVISHEFFAAASPEQVHRAVEQLAPAEVHVVVTAREIVGLVTARWQEYVKNGARTRIDRYPAREETSPHNEWDWGTLDLADVLGRWGSAVPPERVHVLPLPAPGAPRDDLWARFAGLIGIDPDSCDLSASVLNESLGVVEVELLRRINGQLSGFGSALDRGNWIRGYLAQGKLVPRKGEKFWPSEARVQQLRERGERAADFVQQQGFDVRGDAAVLRTPEQLPERRHPDDVTDAELVEAATATIAAMLSDVRDLTRERRTLEARVSELEGPGAARLRSGGRRLLRRVRSAGDRATGRG